MHAEAKCRVRPDIGVGRIAHAAEKFGRAAAMRGAEMLKLGYSVDQVVHDYGDICQAVTALAFERNVQISADEFRTLNGCLDDAIADAVASFCSARQVLINGKAQTLHDRLIEFSDEHCRLVDIATQAFSAIKSGHVGLTGATSTLLMHTFKELSTLPERTLAETLPLAESAAAA